MHTKIIIFIIDNLTSANPLSPGVSAFAIALGHMHTCAIVSGGGVKCWGKNENGQLGIGSTTDATSPADVEGDGCPPSHLCNFIFIKKKRNPIFNHT
jgi:hypothetical protein